jgi:hypothetical protein
LGAVVSAIPVFSRINGVILPISWPDIFRLFDRAMTVESEKHRPIRPVIQEEHNA